MGKFNGKKILILGTSTMSYELVDYARRNGAYTIVTDYYPTKYSKVKQLADESLDISTADTDKLLEFCRKKEVDGVFAGISEFNLLQAQRISDILGLRFYCTECQWNSIQKKDCFDDLCKKNHVNKPECYFSGTELEFWNYDGKFQYPVVLKPVDGSASKGVRICNNREDIVNSIKIAIDNSPSGKIIIQQYINGDEFTAHYTISNGKVALACVDNRYPVGLHEGDVTTIPIARVYPSIFLNSYLEKVNPSLIKLCKSVGLQNAVLFVQGLYDKIEDNFYIFEGGLRSAAELPCRFLEKITGLNHWYMILDYILLGRTDYDICKESPDLKGKCCAVVSFASPGGKVGEVKGFEQVVREIPQIICAENRYPKGSTVPNGDTLKQIMLRFVIVCKDRYELSRIIAKINAFVSVNDENGNNMVVKMDANRVFGIQ